MFDVQNFLVDSIKAANVYVPSFQNIDESAVRLNSNENPYSLPERIQTEISKIDFSRINTYPHETSIELRRQAAEVYKAGVDNIAVGIGSSELLSYLFRLFLETGECAAMPSPGFTYNRMLASLQGGYLKEIAWKDGYQLPIKDLISSGAKFLIIVNPNNPTGTTVSHRDIRALLENFDGPVVVDEAYIDFCGQSSIPYLKDYDNLIVLRTLSKAYSAAGIRVGFCFASEAIIQELNKVRSLYSTNVPAEKIATILLRYRKDFNSTIESINGSAIQAEAQLQEMGFEPIKTKTNFLLAKVPEHINAHFLKEELEKRNYLVRHFGAGVLKDYIRISIGTKLQMEGLFSQLALILDDRK